MNQNTQTMDHRPTEAPKIVDWPKAPSVRDLQADRDLAKPSHDAMIQKISKWNDLLNVSGSEAPKKIPGRSSVQPKLIRRQAEWRYSALTEPFLGTDKLFKVEPRTWEDTAAAEQNSIVLNYQFKEQMNTVNLIDNFVRSTVDDGSCIVRVGWIRETEKVKENLPQFEHYELQTEEEMQAFVEALSMSEENPRKFNEEASEEQKAAVDFFKESQVPTTAVITGYVPTVVEKIKVNKPTLDILNPANVMIDPSCNGKLEHAKFVVVSFESCKADLEAEGRYKNLNYVNWDGNAPVTTPDHATSTPTDFQFLDSSRKRVVVYEYWGFRDVHGDGVLTSFVASWVGDTLIRMEENPFPDKKLPFVLCTYSPVKRELYGTPDAELLEDNQKISGAIYRGMIDSLGRSANSQTGFAKGTLDPLNRRRYDNGQDFEFNPGTTPDAAIHQFKYPEIPQSALTMITLQDQQAEGLVGVKAFSGGMSGNAYGDVAAGIRGMLDAASKREMAILRRLAQAIAEIGAKIISMNAVFLSEKETVRITNEKFVSVYREDLAGNFDLKVDIATAEVDEAKAQDLAMMMQTLGNTFDFDITKLILSEIATLKRMPELAHRIKNFVKEPTPQEQEMMELELEEKRMQVAKLQSEIDLNKARAEKELAAAASQINDTAEQSDGIKHNREMAKQKAQSQGNQNYEITKALTRPIKEGERAPDIEAAVGFNQLSDTLNSAGTTRNPLERDAISEADPSMSLGSSQFDPSQDPSLNQGINL